VAIAYAVAGDVGLVAERVRERLTRRTEGDRLVSLPAHKWRRQRELIIELITTIRKVSGPAKRDTNVRRVVHLINELDNAFGLIPDPPGPKR
jgi:hypothetical protein